MKKFVTISGGLLALVLLSFVFLSGRTVSTMEDDLARLQKINATFIHDFVTNDVATHDKIIHTDFECINGKGGRVNRKDYMTGWATGFDPKVYAYWDYRAESIRIFGNVALVSATTKFTRIVEGKEVTGMTRYTDTYLKENNDWRCIQVQLTPVSSENYPGDETIVRKYIYGKVQ